MNENKCIFCGAVIPEGRQICWSCEHSEIKVGSILQSYGVTMKEVDNAYTSLNKSKEVI